MSVSSRLVFVPAALWLAASATPAMCQVADVSGRPEDLKRAGDPLTLGAGVAVIPDYVGARDLTVTPMAAARGRLAGIGFDLRGTAIATDLVPAHDGPGWKISAGPLAALRLDRNRRVSNRQVRALGKRRKAWELGGSFAVQRTGILTEKYDTLSASVSYQKDVGDAHRSYIISPSLDYDTPLSEHALISVSVAADYVGKRFGRYYFEIDEAGAVASSLPRYDRAGRAGWLDWNVNLLAAHSLTGTLEHGLGVFVAAQYSRLLGRYAGSPIVADVGNRNQFTGAIGLEFTFR